MRFYIFILQTIQSMSKTPKNKTLLFNLLVLIHSIIEFNQLIKNVIANINSTMKNLQIH